MRQYSVEDITASLNIYLLDLLYSTGLYIRDVHTLTIFSPPYELLTIWRFSQSQKICTEFSHVNVWA